MGQHVRKYVLILLVLLTSLLCTVGASTWIILSEKTVAVPDPYKFETTGSGALTATGIYEGETPTINYSEYIITGENGANVEYTVSYDATGLSGSATSADGITADLEVTFTPTSEIYKVVTQTVQVPLKAVAYTKTSSGNMYYSSIQGAIEAVGAPTSLTDVVIVTGTNINIKNDITIPKNVNLVLPFYDSLFTAGFEAEYTSETTPYIDYDYGNTYKYTVGRTEEGTTESVITKLHAKKSGTSTNLYDYTDGTAAKVAQYRKILLTMTEGKDITIESGGCLSLGGEYGLNSMKGRYAQINLDKGSSIEVKSGGEFYCEGFVKEINAVNGNQAAHQSKMDNALFDADRLIHVHNGGFLQTGLAIYDMKSGGDLTGLINNNIFAINKFDFPYLQTFVQVDYGGEFYTFSHASVSIAGTTQQVNKSAPILLPSGSTAVFNLSDGNACFEYCPNNVTYTSATAKTRIFVNGDLDLGSMTLKIATYTITTVNNYTPLSHKFAVFINDGGAFNVGDKVKLLPGSSLQVNKGGALNINSSFIAYTQEHSTYIKSYGSSYADAKFINNGTVTLGASGSIGAFIQTTATDTSARLDLSKVANKDSFSATSDEGTPNITEISVISQGNFVDDSEEGVGLYQFVAGSTVTSAGKVGDVATNAWTGEKDATRELNVVINTVTKPVYTYKIYVADDENGTGKQELTLTGSPYSIASNQYVMVEYSRCQATIDGETLIATEWYSMASDRTVEITPSEGVLLKITTDSKSGAGNITYTIYESTTEGGSANVAVYTTDANENVYIRKGYTFKIDGAGVLSFRGTIKSGPTTGSYKLNNELIASADYAIHFSFTACIVEGTLITLADGTQKAVEDLNVGDNLLVFNHYTGKYDVKPLIVNAHANQPAEMNEVLNVQFSNGALWRIVGTHGLFDCTLNKYVIIARDNIDEYVGHDFYYTDGEKGYPVTLTEYFVTEEMVKVYSPATLDFANYFANGLLNAPPLPATYTAGQMNYFDFDENMKVDEEKMQADIEKYGLYTYEDFKDYISEEFFEALPFKYFKISVGKGLMTWEDIIATIRLIQEST